MSRICDNKSPSCPAEEYVQAFCAYLSPKPGFVEQEQSFAANNAEALSIYESDRDVRAALDYSCAALLHANSHQEAGLGLFNVGKLLGKFGLEPDSAHVDDSMTTAVHGALSSVTGYFTSQAPSPEQVTTAINELGLLALDPSIEKYPSLAGMRLNYAWFLLDSGERTRALEHAHAMLAPEYRHTDDDLSAFDVRAMVTELLIEAGEIDLAKEVSLSLLQMAQSDPQTEKAYGVMGQVFESGLSLAADESGRIATADVDLALQSAFDVYLAGCRQLDFDTSLCVDALLLGQRLNQGAVVQELEQRIDKSQLSNEAMQARVAHTVQQGEWERALSYVTVLLDRHVQMLADGVAKNQGEVDPVQAEFEFSDSVMDFETAVHSLREVIASYEQIVAKGKLGASSPIYDIAGRIQLDPQSANFSAWRQRFLQVGEQSYQRGEQKGATFASAWADYLVTELMAQVVLNADGQDVHALRLSADAYVELGAFAKSSHGNAKREGKHSPRANILGELRFVYFQLALDRAEQLAQLAGGYEGLGSRDFFTFLNAHHENVEERVDFRPDSSLTKQAAEQVRGLVSYARKRFDLRNITEENIGIAELVSWIDYTTHGKRRKRYHDASATIMPFARGAQKLYEWSLKAPIEPQRKRHILRHWAGIQRAKHWSLTEGTFFSISNHRRGKQVGQAALEMAQAYRSNAKAQHEKRVLIELSEGPRRQLDALYILAKGRYLDLMLDTHNREHKAAGLYGVANGDALCTLPEELEDGQLSAGEVQNAMESFCEGWQVIARIEPIEERYKVLHMRCWYTTMLGESLRSLINTKVALGGGEGGDGVAQLCAPVVEQFSTDWCAEGLREISRLGSAKDNWYAVDMMLAASRAQQNRYCHDNLDGDESCDVAASVLYLQDRIHETPHQRVFRKDRNTYASANARAEAVVAKACSPERQRDIEKMRHLEVGADGVLKVGGLERLYPASEEVSMTRRHQNHPGGPRTASTIQRK